MSQGAKDNRAIRRMPIRTRVIPFDGDYDGWHATVRINVPMRVMVGIEEAKKNEDLFDLLAEVGIESNFVDDNGKVINIHKSSDWPTVPPDLMAEFVRKWREAVKAPFTTSTAPAATSEPASSPPSPTGEPVPALTG